jgi:phosphomannomutase
MPRLIMFDLDGTLASSKEPMDAEMAALILQLIGVTNIAIISGGGYPQLDTQFLSVLGVPTPSFGKLFLLPTSGAAMYRYADGWHEIYSETLTPSEKQGIIDALEAALAESAYAAPEHIYGETIEDRGSQISFSANGQEAPLAVKSAWDPSHEKRERIASFLKTRLPEFSIRIGGTNTIDITKHGVDKAYGIRRIENELDIPQRDMLFIGDAIFPGGNDYVVTTSDVPWKKVSGPEETKRIIRELLSSVLA